MQRILFAGLLGMAAIPAAHAAPDCTTTPAPLAVTTRPTVLAPVAAEFTPTVTQLGAPSGVLARSFNDSQTVDRVLQRLRIEGCQNVAKALPAGAAISSTDAAAYKPKTEFDNTPWRFDMNQNGKRMTAEEFDAWMKSRGVRVAKGNGAAAAAAAPVVPATAPAVAPATAPVPAKKD